MTRRPGRPRASEGPVITREQLLVVACGLVARHGLDGTSVRRLAEAADISMGTLQHHFPTKEDLYRAIVDEVLVPALKRSPETGTDLEGRFAPLIHGRVQAAVDRPGLSAQVLLDANDDRFDYLAKATHDYREAEVALLDELIASGRLRPELHRPSLVVLLGVLLPLISSLDRAVRSFAEVDLDDEADRDALVKGLTDIVLHGIAPRESRD